MPLVGEVEDVTQEVFLALLRTDGALEKADPDHGGGFRALLHAVARNVALHAERTRARRIRRVGDAEIVPEHVPADDPTLSFVFDRAYAEAIVRQARRLMEVRSRESGGQQMRRVELLRLIFDEGLPIREIAVRWDADPAQLHRDYAKARREFLQALSETVAGNERWSSDRVEQECRRLLDMLR
jgi:RNA polymerase sigma factor (sigma-70 family)